MRRYLSIVVALLVLGVVGYTVVSHKRAIETKEPSQPVITPHSIGSFDKSRSCVKPPQFLKELKIPQPVMIDLTQKHYTGVALLYGQHMEKALHPKLWEKYAHFGTYSLDKEGNMFLVPTPYISIHPTTFNLQKNLYRLDTHTGKLDIFMHFDEVHPSANNPYGLSAIAYDCQDETLWVASIDETDYTRQRGVIYHVDIKTKKILSQIDGVDALTLAIVKSTKGKYLLLGASRDNALYAYDMQKLLRDEVEPIKLLEIPNVNEHIRKIKVKAHNTLELQTIPFTYTLISQSTKEDRLYYTAKLDPKTKVWSIEKNDK